MQGRVRGLVRDHSQVLRVVVARVAVQVVDDLAGKQRPAELLFGDDAMFVPSVALAVGLAFTASALSGAALLG